MGLETIFRSSLCLPNQNYQILEEWHSGQGLAQGHGWEEAGGARLGAGGFLALSRGGFPTMTLLADPIQPEQKFLQLSRSIQSPGSPLFCN